jgi:hypothetical protein
MPVRLLQRQANLVQEVRYQRQRRRWLGPLEVRERLPVEQFHHEIWDLAPAGGGDSEIGDVDDIYMPQTAARLRFPLKSRQELWGSRPLRRDYLHRHHPRGSEVRGEINISHSASAQLAVDTVLAVEDFTDHDVPIITS